MKKEQTILRMSKKALLVITLFLCCTSCNNKNRLLKNAIKWDAIICPLVYTENSDTILIYASAQEIVCDLQENFNQSNAEDIIYQSLKEGKAIHLSEAVYEDFFAYQIQPDSEMDSCYNHGGVKGLLNNYFKIGMTESSNWPYILRNQQEIFVEIGSDPYPAYGLEHNAGYMTYLLSKNDIYLTYDFIDHIIMIILCTGCSDLSPYINEDGSIKQE